MFLCESVFIKVHAYMYEFTSAQIIIKFSRDGFSE